MRSYEQTMEIVRECQRIEQAGGDVIEYIRVNWPSYSPRATWYSIQNQYLGRKPDQYTEGKPKQARKEWKKMGKMEQTVRGLILCKETGADIRHFLLDNGYADPCTALANMKYTMKTKDPALYDQIKDLSLQRKKSTKPATDKPQEPNNPDHLVKPTETVEIPDKFGGTKRIKLYGEPEIHEANLEKDAVKVVPDHPEDKTEHINAKEYRETLQHMQQPQKDEAWTDALPVCAVKSQVAGKWELARNEGFVHLIYQETQCLTLHRDNWLKLAEEIPQMLMQLGLAK